MIWRVFAKHSDGNDVRSVSETPFPVEAASDRSRRAGRQKVGPVISAFALLVIPTGILLYYFLFYLSLFAGAALLFVLLVAAVSRPGDYAVYQCLPILILFAWWGVTLFWTPATDFWLLYATTGLYAAFAFLAGPLKTRFDDRFALRLMTFCAAAFAICGAVAFAQFNTVVDETKGAIRTLLGAYFLVGLPGATYLAFRYRSIMAGAVILAMIAVGADLGSRTFVLISLPAVVLTLMVIGRGSRFMRLARWPIIVISALAVAAVVLEASNFSAVGVMDKLSGRASSFAVDEATFAEAKDPAAAADDLERRLLVAVGMESFNRSPIFGAGFLSTRYYVGFYYAQEMTAHGLPFFLLGETGLIGTLIFLIALWVPLTGYYRHAKLLNFDGASVAYVELITLVVILFNGLFHQVYSDFYFYLFLGIGAWRRHQAISYARTGSRSHVGLSN